MVPRLSSFSCWLTVSLLLFLPPVALAQESPVWDVTLQADRQAASDITITNRCFKTHNFRVTKENLPFLELLGEPELSVPAGSATTLPVRFNTAGMSAGQYSGTAIITCLTCASEPGCTQDREHLGVNLTVTAPPATPAETPSAPATSTRRTTPTASRTEERNPCEELRRDCDELRRIAQEKERAARAAQARATAARAEAEAKQEAAQAAEARAREAEQAAQPEPEGSWVESEGRRITSRDLRLRSRASQQAWQAYRNGDITAQELEQRWEALNTPEQLEKLRERYKQELEERQREAEEAHQQAEEARQAAEASAAAAAQAEAEAQQARAEANQAQSDLAACEARLRVCEEQAAAEAARREAEARAAAQAEERRRRAEATRAAAIERQQEHYRWLLHNIEELNLIRSPEFWETPGLYNWLPQVLQAPVSYGLEDIAKLPIPTDTLGALAGLYGLVGKMLDPCTALGLSKTVQRLEERVNSQTGQNYTFEEAYDKTNEMCRLLRRLHSLADAAGRQ